MIRGTTPTIIFEVISDIDISSMKEIWVTLKRMSKELTLKLSKGEIQLETIEMVARSSETEDSDVELTPIRRIKVPMTQEHTLLFDVGKIEAQVRFLDENDVALASKIVELDMDRVLKVGEIYA